MLPDLLFEPGHNIARCVGGNQKGGHSPIGRPIAGHRNHDGHLPVLSAGNKLLYAIEQVVISLAAGGTANLGGVRPCLRFGEAKSTEPLPLGERKQELLFLCLAAKCLQDAADRAVIHGDGSTRAAIGGGNLLND